MHDHGDDSGLNTGIMRFVRAELKKRRKMEIESDEKKRSESLVPRSVRSDRFEERLELGSDC